jgi:putative ABC transport system substrate-binding protein
MRRREFLTGFAATTAWPLGANAQPIAFGRVGFLGANSPATSNHLVDAFIGRLRDLGWIENKNLAIEYRWAAGRTAKFGELAQELVDARPNVIVTSGNAAAIAAARVTRDVPIILAASADILSTGLVKSLSRPGGNVTGLTFVPEDTVGKRLEILKEIVPNLKQVAVLYNPDANPEQVVALRPVAAKLGVSLSVVEFTRVADLARINALPERNDIGGLFVVSDPLVFVNRAAINEFAMREKLPTIHMLREYVADGGTLAYGPHFPDFFRRAADFVDKVLRGTKTEDLPVERATIFRLVVNVKIAKALGLTIPEAFLLRADEVIE